MNIFEGLKIGDLKNLVSPTISVDEYNSKLDDTAIVVGFYISFKDPAEDLNRFIQKSPQDIIDTDISPAPDEDGNYMVFVELPRDNEFPDQLFSITNSLSSLTGNKSWFFRAYGSDESYKLTPDNLRKTVDLSPDVVDESELVEFFKDSNLDDIIIEDENISLIKGHNILKLGLIDFAHESIIYEQYHLDSVALKLTESDIALSNRVRSYLGPNWNVQCLDNSCLYISRGNSTSVLLADV